MNTRITLLALIALLLTHAAWAQEVEDDLFAIEGIEEEQVEPEPEYDNEIEIGAYHLDEDALRFGKYTGLTDEGTEPLINFRLDSRDAWDADTASYFHLEGQRLWLDSRRLLLEMGEQGVHDFTAHYREIPNFRIADGMTPYAGAGTRFLSLPPDWRITPESNNTSGFEVLDESLRPVDIDVKRRRMEFEYLRRLGPRWNMDVDYRHETKDGTRTMGAVIGNSGGNPRAAILPAPVDYTTDVVEAMLNYATQRVQFGFGVHVSLFSQDPDGFIWDNAFGQTRGWDDGVGFPDGQGRLSLEPDNSAWQLRAYGGLQLTDRTRLAGDLAWGTMEQDELLFPYTVNPNLATPIPLPREEMDAEIDTMHLNLRLTTSLAPRVGLVANYTYDDRDNKTPQDVWVNVGGDSQNQKDPEDGRLNLPYSYEKHLTDVTATWRATRGLRLKGGARYKDISRTFQEVEDSDETTVFAGISLRALENASFSFDVEQSERDIDNYVHNLPLLATTLPGSHDEDDFENVPILRKYFMFDRDRDHYRLRADWFPSPLVNLGLSASRSEDDYGDNFLGLNESEVESWSVDAGFFPNQSVNITGYYTMERYDTEQSNRSWRGSAPDTAFDPTRNWFADVDDDVDTWNIALAFPDIGERLGLRPGALEMGLDYTRSEVESLIAVTGAEAIDTAPLPELRSDMTSFSAFARFQVNDQSGIRLAVELAELETDDFALDNVEPDTLSNVLLLGESAANYDVTLVSLSYIYRW